MRLPRPRRCVAEMAYLPRLEQETLSDIKHPLTFDWYQAAAAAGCDARTISEDKKPRLVGQRRHLFNSCYSLCIMVMDVLYVNGVFVLLIRHLAEATPAQVVGRGVYMPQYPVFFRISPVGKIGSLKPAYLGF